SRATERCGLCSRGKARSAAIQDIPRLALRLAGLPNVAGCVARVRREAPPSGTSPGLRYA
ncbi:TPA: hypothetical protein ACKE7U_004855, partial [Klebsiella aerogenes]